MGLVYLPSLVQVRHLEVPEKHDKRLLLVEIRTHNPRPTRQAVQFPIKHCLPRVDRTHSCRWYRPGSAPVSGSSIFRIVLNEPVSDLHGGGYAAYLACLSFVGSEEEWI